MTDPANDPAGPYNEDADRQGNTAPEADTIEAPEGLPWELNPAVERPPGNYETLAEANEASGAAEPSTSAVDDAPATAPGVGPGDAPVTQPGTVTGPTSKADVASGDTATDAPISETGETAPTATSDTVSSTHTETQYEGE